ncbi:glycosyltransferase [Nocardioides nematodiphilus]|uniref:glycosyltransferase n=1 Tax=Nocardioides nematodiphilus TaxID=2849669 RepID=UPI001CDA1FBE|nr:glycosyltransferase [Nocardioides nematodiphilus]MCA1983541.1 glycosyltransferase [Nocardioides nematodiphilus]
MRIALVTDTFYPATDGATTTVKAIADRLIETGHDVRFIAPGPGLPSYNRSRVVRVNPVAKPGGQVRDALADFEPDLVQVINPGRLGRKALKHARELGLRTIAVQQAPVAEATAEYWRSRVADRADHLVVTARWMVERLAELDVEAELWLPGVDGAAFAPSLRDPWLAEKWSRASRPQGRQVVVGYVGALAKRHGVRQLADLRASRNVRPVIIGDGAQRGWLEQRLPDARFTGALTAGDLATAVASLDVLVHPGTAETCSHSLREAGASGLPVIAPRAGGAVGVVRHLETGLLYDPTDERGLADAIAAVAADPQRGLLGERGREVALARSWRDAVDELVGPYVLAPA